MSSTVQVLDEQGRPGYAYVNFSPPLLVRVGKALARGISERNPAFLRVEYSAHFRQWLIAAQYLDDSEVAILWHEKKQPTWLRIHYPRAPKTKEPT